MGFAENLKQIRRQRNLSQEELAEILGVSRQAVSKWEQDLGYPETEKLLLLSKELNISLDELMATEFANKESSMQNTATGTITIFSPNENVIATCYKVISSGKMRGGKSSPQYALYGASKGYPSFWGEPTVFLGWYKDKEHISKEITEIKQAIESGIATYTLKYSAKTERSFINIRITEE
ncbi:MAG: helix-turn-helix transcriptional regulator [Anaerofustis stercorihominis]|nr:helix-turn-helix transcriptional regulator [Anaerofustis stercorihominis]